MTRGVGHHRECDSCAAAGYRPGRTWMPGRIVDSVQAKAESTRVGFLEQSSEGLHQLTLGDRSRLIRSC